MTVVRLDLDFRGMDGISRKVLTVQTIQTKLRPPMQRSVERVEKKMAAEPGAIPAGHWRANTTPRQRRWFLAALKDGRVSGGRTHAYSRGWQTEVTGAADGLTGRIHNPVAHGMYVGAKGKQAAFLRNRWPADQDVVDEAEPGIRRDFADTVQKIIDEE